MGGMIIPINSNNAQFQKYFKKYDDILEHFYHYWNNMGNYTEISIIDVFKKIFSDDFKNILDKLKDYITNVGKEKGRSNPD